jgi:hypothetical protein
MVNVRNSWHQVLHSLVTGPSAKGGINFPERAKAHAFQLFADLSCFSQPDANAAMSDKKGVLHLEMVSASLQREGNYRIKVHRVGIKVIANQCLQSVPVEWQVTKLLFYYSFPR